MTSRHFDVWLHVGGVTTVMTWNVDSAVSRAVDAEAQGTTRGVIFADLAPCVRIDTKLRESPVVGKPITLYRSRTRGAMQYRALAEELMQYE